MGEIKWCPNCVKNVRMVKPFNWWIVLLLPFWILYTLWYIVAKRPKCPICGEMDAHPWKTDIEEVWTFNKGKAVLENKGENQREHEMSSSISTKAWCTHCNKYVNKNQPAGATSYIPTSEIPCPECGLKGMTLLSPYSVASAKLREDAEESKSE